MIDELATAHAGDLPQRIVLDEPKAVTARPRPRVLVLTSTFPRWERDTEPRFVLDLCRHLSLHADVLVLAPHTRGAATEEVLEGVGIRRFRYFVSGWQSVAYSGGITARLRENPARLLLLPFFFTSLAWALRRTMATWRPDVIHAHWIFPQAFIACLVAGARVPILCTSHGGDLHGLRGIVFRALKRWTLRRCSAITVVSASMVPDVHALSPGSAIDVMPMGTDLTGLFAPPERNEARESAHLLFVGRLVEKKGVSNLLRAFVALQRTHPAARLTIAGDGPLRHTLVELCTRLGLEERVTFLGGIRHDQLPELYRRATLAVFPFVVAADGDQEGFGLVVVEAMGCGCPVVASDLPALRESIEHEVTGLLAPPGDPEALAAIIRRALDDPPMRREIAQRALERARVRFDWPVVGQRYAELIHRLNRNRLAAGGATV